MSRNKITIILIIILLSVCGLAGCGSFKNISINDIAEKVYPVSCTTINEEEAKKIQDKVPIHLYYATKQNKLKLVVRYISNEQQDIDKIATIVMEELMKNPKEVGLYNVIPQGTKLRKPVKVQNNVSIYERVTLEDYVFCGPSCVFTNVLTPRSRYPKDYSEYL